MSKSLDYVWCDFCSLTSTDPIRPHCFLPPPLHMPPYSSLYSQEYSSFTPPWGSSGMQVTYSPTSLKFLLNHFICVSFSEQIIDYNSKNPPPAIFCHNLFRFITDTDIWYFIYLLPCLWSVLPQEPHAGRTL